MNTADALLSEVWTLLGPLILSRGALVSIVNDREVAVPELPAGSIARTANPWRPSASGPNARGEEQGTKSCASRRHLKADPGSLAANRNDGLGSAEAEPSAGPEEIVVVGAFVSTVKYRDATSLSTSPSTALTLKRWRPSPSRRVVNDPEPGPPQDSNGAASPPTLQLNVARGSAELKANLGVGSAVVAPGRGPLSIRTSTGGASIVQLRVTVDPTLPARSVGATENEVEPFESRLVVAWGDVHGAGGLELNEHSKLTPGSSAKKMNDGLGSCDSEPSSGPEAIVTVGGTLSTIHSLPAPPTLPAGSLARTWNAWEPSLSVSPVSNRNPQGLKPRPSSWQVTVALGSLTVNSNDALRPWFAEPFAGPDVIVTDGGVVSTVNGRPLLSLTLPGASIAWTESLWGPSASRGVLNCGPHRSKAPLSIRHWKVEPASVEPKVNLGLGSLITLPAAGPEVNDTVGGSASAL
jgi:hypothetical protein